MPKKNTSGKKQTTSERPARTREHYIADLSLNHVERFALLEGFTVIPPHNDYGYDAAIKTYDYKDNMRFESGDMETGDIYLQLKATDKLNVLRDGATMSFPISRKHVELWREEVMPVILIVYDAATETAYWLYAQRYFKSPALQMTAHQQEVAVHIPKANVVDQKAMQTFREFKKSVLQRMKGVYDLHE